MRRIKSSLCRVPGFFAVALLLCIPASAQRERPECPPTHPGACFDETTGNPNLGNLTIGGVFDFDGDFVVAYRFDDPSNNNYIKSLPNGTAITHTQGDDWIMNFCPSGVGIPADCFVFTPKPVHVFQGTARLNVLRSTLKRSNVGPCPTTLSLQGTGQNGYGDIVDVHANFVRVPDPNSGCKIVINEVTAIPVD